MEERAIGVLRFCAWIDLVVCLAAAITIWIAGSANTGVISAVSGVSSWAFLLVVSSMAESLIEIRTNTRKVSPLRSRSKLTYF